jgi:hypothetical protein
MQGLTFLFFFISFTCAKEIRRIRTDSLVPHAIKGILDKYHSKNIQDIQILNFGEKKGKGDEIVNNLLKLENHSSFVLNASSILIFDSFQNARRSVKRVTLQPFPNKRLNHLIHIHGAEMIEIKGFRDQNATIDRVDFLYNNERDDAIDIMVAFMFSPKMCRTNFFKTVDRFKRKEMQWMTRRFFVEKYKDFHGCPIRFSSSSSNVPLLYEVFAKHLNFRRLATSKKNFDDEFEFQYIYYVNIRSDLLTCYVDNIQASKIFIPPGELYGDYEKIFLPFDSGAWIAIALTILMVVSAITAFKVLSPNNMEIYFGKNNKYPMLNFVSILLNGCQHTSLVSNVPRMFLMIFLFWSLVIR